MKTSKSILIQSAAGAARALLGTVLAIGGFITTAASAEADPLAAYFDNTYIWKNQATKVVGRMWLNRDGKYFAFYNMGPQQKMPDSNGPWQVQGREGSYTLRAAGMQYQLCLWPAAPRIDIGAAQQQELYAEGRCYSFTPHQVGEVWNASDDPQNRAYKFWLVKGR